VVDDHDMEGPESKSSNAASARRKKNFERFLSRAIAKHGSRFDYSRVDFINQRTPVTIGCPDHGWISQTPDRHLASEGCWQCGVDKRAKLKLARGRQKFLAAFAEKHGEQLRLVTTYEGATAPITVECLAEGHRIDTTPDRLNNYFRNGCTLCRRQELGQQKQKTTQEFLDEAIDRFPDFDYSDTTYTAALEPIRFSCPWHGPQERQAASFLRSRDGCPDCGRAQTGYAGNRIKRLRSNDPDVRPRPTRIALMSMDIDGIETYKLGITSFELERRYGAALREVFFEAVLNELDALLLEQLLHQKYRDYRDHRVYERGVRTGDRWAGDQECYCEDAVKPMLQDLRNEIAEIERTETDYWDRHPDLKVPIFEPRKSRYDPNRTNAPRKVVCLETERVFDSVREAARQAGTRDGNVWAVCVGRRGHAKGRRFAFLDDYQAGRIPEFDAYSVNKKMVRCIDTDEVFQSINDAAEAKGVNASKITAVCRGRRKSTGGLRWEYVDA